MTLSGIILKYQNLYSQQETDRWQITLDLREGAEDIIDAFQSEFIGEKCEVLVKAENKEVQFIAEAHEAKHNDSSKGVDNRVYFRLPNSNKGREVFARLMDFVNTPCQIMVRKEGA